MPHTEMPRTEKPSPFYLLLRLVLVILLSAFVTELAVHFMQMLPGEHVGWWHVMAEAAILPVALMPALYFAMFRPLRAQMEARQKFGQQLWAAQREGMMRAIVALADSIEMRDIYKVGHQARVGRLAAAIGAEICLPPAQQDDLGFAARVHDIGILAVPVEILNRPTPLLGVERQLLQNHSQAGYDLLHRAGFAERAATILLQHHERLDGSGYPRGLKGEAILTEARIVAVADVVEAMSSKRAWREALGVEAALHEIGRNRGRLYDAAVVDACLRLFREKGFTFANP